MVDIFQHIDFLLRHHNCVIIPNFGAFIVSYKSAYINDEWGILSPPKREIYFNSSITNNDGLLANSIARKEKIPFENAQRILAQNIENLKTSLIEDKEVNFANIGIIRVGEENNLLFQPLRKRSQTDNFWGLQPLKLTSLENIDKQEHDTTPSIAHNRSDKNYYIPINKRLVHYAAMLLIVFLASISLSLPSDNKSTINYASVIPVTTTTVKKLVSPIVVKEPTKQVAPPQETKIQQPQADNYYLIVASLSSDEEALKFIESCPNNDDLKIVSTSSMSRVYAQKSSNRDELMKTLNSPKFRQIHSQAWIWKPKQ